MTTYAVIIKHPFREFDWRVDVVESDLSPDEIKEQIEREMLGPFQVISVTSRLDLKRVLRPQEKIKIKPLAILGVSGKRPDSELFCKVYSQEYGEKVDSIYQIVIDTFDGGELLTLCHKYHQAACASGAVDTVAERGACEHECTGPSDCHCPEMHDKFYRDIARKSSEGQP